MTAAPPPSTTGNAYEVITADGSGDPKGTPPSRRRDRDRVARAIAAGEQLTGQVHMSLVPGGAGPKQFLADMARMKHPLESPPPLPQRLLDAMEVICACSEEALMTYREEIMSDIRQGAAELEQFRAEMVDQLHPRVRRVIGHIHLLLLSALLKAIDYTEDSMYMASLLHGRPMLGKGELTTGLYPSQHSKASRSLDEWARCPRERNLEMIRSVRASKDPDLDWTVWKKVQKEVERGYATIHKLDEYDLNRVCLTPRFPKWELKESGEWAARPISDFKRSGGNDTVDLRQRYLPEDLVQLWAVTRRWKDRLGDSAPLLGYRVDYEMAFRQCPKDPPQAHLTLELV